jgi:hypothetical protein
MSAAPRYTWTKTEITRSIRELPPDAVVYLASDYDALAAKLAELREATLSARGWYEGHPELALEELEHRAKALAAKLAEVDTENILLRSAHEGSVLVALVEIKNKLEAERDALKAEVEAWKREEKTQHEGLLEALRQRDALKALVDELKLIKVLIGEEAIVDKFNDLTDRAEAAEQRVKELKEKLRHA